MTINIHKAAMMMTIILTVNTSHPGAAPMGHSKHAKADSHERIVATAAARFREVGIEGVGVADLMKEAGLTHGGFYRHFGSRDELVAEAVERALADGKQAAESLQNMQRPAAAVLALLIDGYLSITHRDQLATSCAVTTLAGDVARSNERTRTAYTQQVERYLDLLGHLIAADKQPARKAKAMAALATLVGAVSIARAVNDPQLSGEILKSAAQELKAQLSDGSS